MGNRIGKFPYGQLNRSTRVGMHGGPEPAPVLLLKFGEGTGSTCKDSSPSGYDGTIDGATWVTGKKGKALDFDGDNDYITCGDVLAFVGKLPFSVFAWINLETITGGWQQIANKLGFDVGEQPAGWEFTINPAGYLACIRHKEDIVYHRAIATTVLPTGIWLHVGATFDGYTLQLWRNGIAFGNPKDKDMSYLANDADFEIGRNSKTATNYFTGIIDEVHIYDVALTAAQIVQLCYGFW